MKRKLYYALLILWVMYAWTQLVITAMKVQIGRINGVLRDRS